MLSALVVKFKILIDICILRKTLPKKNYSATQGGGGGGEAVQACGASNPEVNGSKPFLLKTRNIYPFSYVDKPYIDMFQ